MPVQCIARSVISHIWADFKATADKNIFEWQSTGANGTPWEPKYFRVHLARGHHISQRARGMNLATALNCSHALEAKIGRTN